MGPKSKDWKNDPCLAPPFAVLDYGESSSIVDREGRMFMFEQRAKCFVEELCRVLNENSERLVKAWKRSSRKARKAKKARR